jgi:hypothetical protein
VCSTIKSDCHDEGFLSVCSTIKSDCHDET